MHAEGTVVVGRPVEVVFEFLASARRCTRWRSGIREIGRMTHRKGSGAVYRQILIGPGGRDMDGDFVVTGFEPPHRLEFAVIAGPVRPVGRFELTECGQQFTEVRFVLDAQARGLRRLMMPVWGRMMRNEVAQLDRLRDALEN